MYIVQVAPPKEQYSSRDKMSKKREKKITSNGITMHNNGLRFLTTPNYLIFDQFSTQFFSPRPLELRQHKEKPRNEQNFVQNRNLIFSIQLLFGQIPMCLHSTRLPISSFARSRFGILLYEIEDYFLSITYDTHCTIKISLLAFNEWTLQYVFVLCQ